MKINKRIYLRVLAVLAGIAVIAGLWFLIRSLIPPSNISGEFKTTLVDRGPVVLSQDAKGVVVPGNEVVLLSPASSVITSILKPAGSRVRSGETILRLDPKIIEDNIESLEDQLEIKRNDLLKNKLNARSTKIDLDYNVEVKKLRIVSLKSELADQEQLLGVGGISPAQYDRTKQELVLAEKELEMVLEKNSIRLQQLEAEEKGLKLQIEVQEKDLAEKISILTKMNVRAASDGIILAVYGNVGEKVNTDQLLVRMSDLTSYKINGSIDENRANILKTGGTVYAVIGDEKLEGLIGTVMPMVENNTVRFDVFLEQSNHPKLIPNMNTALKVIVSQRDSVIRMKKELVIGRGNKHDVYVVQNGKATRKKITTGLVGLEFVEIISGLHEGDQLIISDLAAFHRKKEIEIPE